MGKVILKLENLFYRSNFIKSIKYRWLFTIGILVFGLQGLAQRNNVWPLGSLNSTNPKTNYNYCLDFNYCPPINRKMFVEHDKNLRYIYNKYAFFFQGYANSFCDTSGQFAFTEVIGQHYYNNKGIIYDSTYLGNKPDGYGASVRGASLTSGDKTYYFSSFNITKYNVQYPEWSQNWLDCDSILICVSEFDNNGKLLKKNTPILRFLNDSIISRTGGISAFNAKMHDREIAEIFINTHLTNKNFVLWYNLKSEKIVKQKSLTADSIANFKYSTKKNKIITREYIKNKGSGMSLFEQNANMDYDLKTKMDFSKYPPLAKKYIFYDGIYDFCFSPNDSIVYTTVSYRKDTLMTNKPYNTYLLAFNYYKPYSDFKFILLYEQEKKIQGTNGPFLLKLGPDGNVYGSNLGGWKKSKFRMVHPNSISGSKLEWMPDIDEGNGQYNYSLEISTIEDYKKTEFIWQPTCDSLKVRFTNTCDTQHFKRYRLFFDTGDSIDLNKSWNTKIYNYPKAGKYFVRLKALSKQGGFIWYGDSIEINSPPIAKFGIQKTKGCQWIGYGFTDSSQLFSIKPGFKPYKHWLFGDGKDSIDASANPKLTYIYTTSNTFTVKLVVNNGYCTDTASQVNNVVILPAPKPGIIAAPIEGCTPLKVNFSYKYADLLDSAVWRSGFAASPHSYKGISGNFNYPQSGNFFLSQKLYGPSGCITSDSVLIKVHPGISGMPDILNATVTSETTIDLKWKKHINAVSYSVVKNNSFLAWTPDTTYTDKTANTLMANSYSIKAISMCNDSTTIQDLAQTIYLQATRTDNNEAQLNWTAYQRWEFGVSTYQLFSQNEAGYFELMATINGQTLDYLDEGFAGLSQSQRCYKIITDEKDGNLQQSGSNVYCLPLKPTLLIPNSFSPNGDGVNDHWKIDYKGIKEVNIKIFNRWGEIIYLARGGTEKPEWDAIYKGLPVPVGTYFYQIEATGITVGKVYKSGLVEWVR